MQLLWWRRPLGGARPDLLALCLALGALGCTGAMGGADPGGGAGGGDGKSPESPRQSDDPDRPSAGSDPGTVAVRRLNALEYNNTVRDLLGTSKRPADGFAVQDKAVFGFDNNANALDVDLPNLEGYGGAAQTLASEVMSTPALKERLLTCDPAAEGEACVSNILRTFAGRAYRRPVTDDEVAALAALVKVARDAGDGVEVGLTLALEAILGSPNFLYRIESDPDPSSNKPHAITSYEMASRLSYFLWSTMPDDELFAAAEDDALKDPDDILKQVGRMLTDDKAESFIKSFGGQWIPVRLFETHEVDTGIFKTFNEDIRKAMLAETESMLREVFRGDIGFGAFMTARHTYVNDKLAAYYGLEAPGASEPKRVELDDASHRRGYLTHGSFLAATSQPGTTSIVRRGRYVFEDMLCGEVTEPPGGIVPPFDTSGGGTLREKFERHRKDPMCAGCHTYIDPPGFALENYDAAGGYREMDNGGRIDPAGDLQVDEEVVQISGAFDMADAIAGSHGYAGCVAKALFTFAMGRGPDPADGGGNMDEAVLFDIQDAMKKNDMKFREAVETIVAADTFRKRRPNFGVQSGGKQ